MLTVEKLMQITHPTPDVVSRRKLEDLYLDIFAPKPTSRRGRRRDSIATRP